MEDGLNPAPLSLASLLLRLAIIGAILAVIAGSFAYVGGWLTPHALTPATMINTFEKINGPQPGFRRNHAKGVCFSGTFQSNGTGAALSKAAVFAPGASTPVEGRFALAGGQPYQADAPHTVRSMAVLFHLPDGEEWRTGINNIPTFPVATAQGFYDLLIASAPDPATGKPDPAKMKAFFAQYPGSATALHLIMTTPMSTGFDNSTYNSLNAFRFINIGGEVTPVRWAMVPFEPFAPVSTTDPAMSDKNYLFDALIAGIHSHPLQWHFIVTIGQPGDSTSDSTIPWPPDRKTVDVGTLTIDHVESEDTSPMRDVNFDPLILPSGIKGSDDPLLSARSAAYSQSFTRRESEHKSPSAVSPQEVGK